MGSQRAIWDGTADLPVPTQFLDISEHPSGWVFSSLSSTTPLSHISHIFNISLGTLTSTFSHFSRTIPVPPFGVPNSPPPHISQTEWNANQTAAPCSSLRPLQHRCLSFLIYSSSHSEPWLLHFHKYQLTNHSSNACSPNPLHLCTFPTLNHIQIHSMGEVFLSLSSTIPLSLLSLSLSHSSSHPLIVILFSLFQPPWD